MGFLYSNIAIGFDIYLTFFSIFLIPFITIIGASLTLGLIGGFIYKLNFQR